MSPGRQTDREWLLQQCLLYSASGRHKTGHARLGPTPPGGVRYSNVIHNTLGSADSCRTSCYHSHYVQVPTMSLNLLTCSLGFMVV